VRCFATWLTGGNWNLNSRWRIMPVRRAAVKALSPAGERPKYSSLQKLIDDPFEYATEPEYLNIELQ